MAELPSSDGEDTLYISITGLRLRAWWHFPAFVYHSFRAMAQVRRSAGNIAVDAWKGAGVYHTLTVWENERAVKRFVYQGHHRAAIKVFATIATGKTYGFSSSEIPNRREAVSIWQEKGRNYQT